MIDEVNCLNLSFAQHSSQLLKLGYLKVSHKVWPLSQNFRQFVSKMSQLRINADRRLESAWFATSRNKSNELLEIQKTT